MRKRGVCGAFRERGLVDGTGWPVLPGPSCWVGSRGDLQRLPPPLCQRVRTGRPSPSSCSLFGAWMHPFGASHTLLSSRHISSHLYQGYLEFQLQSAGKWRCF